MVTTAPVEEEMRKITIIFCEMTQSYGKLIRVCRICVWDWLNNGQYACSTRDRVEKRKKCNKIYIYECVCVCFFPFFKEKKNTHTAYQASAYKMKAYAEQ